MTEELDSISHLKVWGNAQIPRPNMAYLLVQVDDIPDARTYGLALVWVHLLQARVAVMADAFDTLATFAYKGPDWPYTLIQLYEGANHMPLPANKHLGVLTPEKMESLSRWISQLEIHQLLSAGWLVVVPMELSGGEQAVTVNLPEPLCTSSSVTSNKHPFIEVNIPSPTTEDQGCTTPFPGRQGETLPTTITKTPWQPRIALVTQVTELLDRGMTDNYDWESEHFVAAEHATQVETSPTQKMEEPLLPLETSSQTSVDGMDVSVESIPANATLVTAVHSSQSDSPIEELKLEVYFGSQLFIHCQEDVRS